MDPTLMDPTLMAQIDVFGLIVTQGQLGTALAVANTRIAALEAENRALKAQLAETATIQD